jgi:hypothetical protein
MSDPLYVLMSTTLEDGKRNYIIRSSGRDYVFTVQDINNPNIPGSKEELVERLELTWKTLNQSMTKALLAGISFALVKHDEICLEYEMIPLDEAIVRHVLSS